MTRYPVLHVRVDDVDLDEALRRTESFLAQPGSRQIVTANPLMILASEEDADLRAAFAHADLVVPDSAGIAWAARRAGVQRPARAAGIDLMERLCARAAEKGWRVYLLGAAPGVAERAAKALSDRYPGLRVAGARNGHFPLDQDDAVVKGVAAAAPDLLFVALGVPRQDGWIHRRLERLNAKVAMGVGGSFDVLAGRLKRAPAWMSAAGLEWLFRLLQQPSRARRMLGLPVFLWKIVKSRSP